MATKTTKKPLTSDQIKDRLFIGVYPCGLVYADRSIEEHGDYAQIAFLSYDTLILDIGRSRSPLLDAIRADAEKIQNRKGEKFQISTSGQYVILGAGIND